MKRKMLAWTDSPTAPTGYGVIAAHVLRAFYHTGKWEIDQIGINFYGEFYDTEKFPWRIQSSFARSPRDNLGKAMFLEALQTGDYDLVWIQIDIQHVFTLQDQIREIQKQFVDCGRTFPQIAYYMPIDMKLQPVVKPALDLCDIIATYSSYGYNQIVSLDNKYKEQVKIIEPGFDPETLVRLSDSARKLFRKSYFGLSDESTFLIININRNSSRKMLTHTLRVFSEFHARVADSKLYLHSDPFDRVSRIDLKAAADALGLIEGRDIQFAKDFDRLHSASRETLTAIYNAADCFLTTSFCEGWGLTHTDAMAVGLPVIAPLNTSFIEQIGEGERGYAYDCKENIWFIEAGYRQVGRLEDILNALNSAYEEISKAKISGISLNKIARVAAAQEWMAQRTWNATCEKWVSVISEC